MKKTFSKMVKAIKSSPLLTFAIISGFLAVATPVVSRLSAYGNGQDFQNTGASKPLVLGSDYSGYNLDASIFNNITNVPKNGRVAHLKGNYPYTNSDGTFDERKFVKIREVGTNDWRYRGQIFRLNPGKRYQVYMYYHNGGRTTTGAVSDNVRAEFKLPNEVKSGNSVKAKGYIHYNKYDNKKDNSPTPAFVMNSIPLVATKDVKLKYVDGSGKLYNRNYNGKAISSAIVGNGVKLGGKANGVVKPCREHSGYVTFEFDAVADEEKEKPVYKCKKVNVKTKGENYFVLTTDIEASEGGDEQRVDYKIFGPSGKLMLSKRLLNTEKLPLRLSVPGEYKVEVSFNGQTSAGCKDTFTIKKKDSPKEEPKKDPTYSCELLNLNQVNKKSFELTTDIEVRYAHPEQDVDYKVYDQKGNLVVSKTKLNTKKLLVELSESGVYKVKASVNGNTSANCQKEFTIEPEKKNPTYSCQLLNANQVSRTKYEFTTDIKVTDDNKVQKVRYEVRDQYGKLYKVEDKLLNNQVFTVNFDKDGVYKVKASVKGNSSASCEKTVQVKPKEKKKVAYSCDLLDLKRSDNKFSFLAKTSTKNATVDEIVYEIKNGKGQLVKTLKAAKDKRVSFDAPDASEKYKVVATVFVTKTEDQTKAQTSSPACEQTFEVIKKVTPKPQPQPEPIEEVTTITETGPADIVSGVFGLASVVASLAYYIDSRKYV